MLALQLVAMLQLLHQMCQACQQLCLAWQARQQLVVEIQAVRFLYKRLFQALQVRRMLFFL